MQGPDSLVDRNRLAHHHIYRTALLNEGDAILVTGRRDEFPEVTRNADGSGVLPDCFQSLDYGHVLEPYHYPHLRHWHSGLSCQIFLREKQQIMFDVDDVDFEMEFDADRDEILTENGKQFRVMLVYELKKGTPIPVDIGIERDGENHVCLYPIGTNIPLSNVQRGRRRFTIDPLTALQPLWRKYAVIRVEAGGFAFPDNFPRDSDLFPFRRWLSKVILCGESDIAYDASNWTKDFIIAISIELNIRSQLLIMLCYLTKIANVCQRYAFNCDSDHVEMNCCISRAVIFAREIFFLQLKQRYD